MNPLAETRRRFRGSEFAEQQHVVQLLVRLTLPREGARDMLTALRSVMLSARLQRGCMHAQILRDIDGLEVVTYVEEWPLPADLETRVRSVAFGHLLTLMEASSAPPSIEIRTVSEIRGLEYVAAVRDGVSS